ncbi:MAG: hypothetical protein ACREO9_04460 [Lysobacterales bacterium]
MLNTRPPVSCLALVLFGMVASCGSERTVEQHIIGLISEMEIQVEAAERRAFMAHVAEDFQGQDGATTRDELNAMVLFQLNQHRRLQAQLGPITVTSATPGTADASFHVMLTGGGGWIPDTGQVFQVTTHWAGRDGDWKLVTANWQAVDVAALLE